MGPVKFLAMIGLPSWKRWGPWSYYDKPWEITADKFGGVQSRPHNSKDISRGWWYLAIATLVGPFAFFFLLE